MQEIPNPAQGRIIDVEAVSHGEPTSLMITIKLRGYDPNFYYFADIGTEKFLSYLPNLFNLMWEGTVVEVRWKSKNYDREIVEITECASSK